MESETKILLSIESLNIFHSTSKKELAEIIKDILFVFSAIFINCRDLFIYINLKNVRRKIKMMKRKAYNI